MWCSRMYQDSYRGIWVIQNSTGNTNHLVCNEELCIHKHYYTHFLQLQLAVCDLYRTGNKEYVLKLYKDPHPRPLHAGIVNMVEVLHRFMASPAVTPTRVE